jgi:general secretion pathway protein M
MSRLHIWFAALTMRERTLVGLAAGLVAVLAVWFGVIAPLARTGDAAQARDVAAVADSDRLLATLHALDAAPRRTPRAQPLDRAVSDTAAQAGIALQTVQPQADGVQVTLTGARGAALFGWIDTLAGSGVVVRQASVIPAPDGTLAVSLTLRRAGP